MQHSLLAQIFARDPRKLARFPDVPLDQALMAVQQLQAALEELQSAPPLPPVLAFSSIGSMPPVMPDETPAPAENSAPVPAEEPAPAAEAAPSPSPAPAPAPSNDGYLEELGGSLASLATQVWRARNRIIDPATGEPREEMRRIHRHVEGAFESFLEMGLVINDWLNQPYDSGLPVKVLTFQPTSDLQRDTVLEATRPTVIWKDRLLQMGEVIVGIPESQSTEAPPPS
jgi:hypothetical protein